jgi:hypothetical protein
VPLTTPAYSLDKQDNMRLHSRGKRVKLQKGGVNTTRYDTFHFERQVKHLTSTQFKA